MAPSPRPSPPATGERVPDLSAVGLAKAEGRERVPFMVPMHVHHRKEALHSPPSKNVSGTGWDSSSHWEFVIVTRSGEAAVPAPFLNPARPSAATIDLRLCKFDGLS